ncbi:hypothetical protein LB556_21990 [Mesorhizobium sp. ES1-4]|nr:hypothetical protein [Mesorhizobium sp. ES1-4]
MAPRTGKAVGATKSRGKSRCRAAALHKGIVKPFISPHCYHYRAMQALHEALLKSVREVTVNMRRSSPLMTRRVQIGTLALSNGSTYAMCSRTL